MISIRSLIEEDYLSVKIIYEQGIATGNATFETDAPAWQTWDKNHLAKGRIVAVDGNNSIVGWAALTPVSGRCVYSGVAELSVYVHSDARNQGVGKLLLTEVILESEHQNIWTLQAGIFPENTASIELHRRCGFRQIGYHEKIGKMKNVWRDTILMERRSIVVGIS
jgi:L-amino acid N-acyltransferase YncA